jgi:hypothetical protein
MNIKHFTQTGRFMCSDDLQLTIMHKAALENPLYLHAEIPWEEATNNTSIATRVGINLYTNGTFLVRLQFLKDSTVDLKLKNGSDIVVSIDTDLKLEFYNVNKVGTDFDLRINDEQEIAASSAILFTVQLYKLQIKKSGTLVEVSAEFDYSINSILSNITPNFLISLILGKWVLPGNLVMAFKGKRVNLIMSLPPSDEPITPCVGLATDPKNLNYALNCLGSMYSLPTFISRLTKTLNVDTLSLLRTFLNEISIGVSLQQPISTINTTKVWSVHWGGAEMEIKFSDIPQENITQALSLYLSMYQSYKFPALPKQAVPILQELPASDPYDHAPWDTFNMKYVNYLSSFLQTEEFFDA